MPCQYQVFLTSKQLAIDLLCVDAGPAAATAKMLVYLSCGFPAFVRDCDTLLESGAWKLHHAEAFLFFPGTDSIETLAIFIKF